MYILFLMLITAHFLGDFVFQTDRMVEQKRENTKVLIKHAAIVTLITLLLTLSINPLLYIAVFGLHFVIDKVKIRRLNDNIAGFFIDQAAHIIAILLIAFSLHRFAYCLLPGRFYYYQYLLTLICGLTLCVSVGSVVVEKFTAQFVSQLPEPETKGLINGGRIIGKLERAIVFLLVVSGQPLAIGFLFAAKSILRFGEIKEPGQRKEAEYIIIGTFASFGWAILISSLASVFSRMK